MQKLFFIGPVAARTAGRLGAGVLALASAFVLQGCVTASGPTFAEHQSTRPAVARDQARLTVFRQKSQLLGARSARLLLEGEKVAGCEAQGFAAIDTTPGAHVLSVDLPDTPGACKLPISVQGGTETFYEVKPRSSAMNAGIVFGLLGQLIESAGKECGGAFSIEAVETSQANALLPQMRLSDEGLYPVPLPAMAAGAAPAESTKTLPPETPVSTPAAAPQSPEASTKPVASLPPPALVTTPALQAGSAHAAQPTILRSRPQLQAAAEHYIPAGAALRLAVRQANRDGVWWFSEYEGRAGWVSEASLMQ